MNPSIRPPTQGETLVLLVRHAESIWNAQHRFQGQMESVPLSELGMKQAEAVARWLASQELGRVHIYSSDMLRACQTAEAIAQAFGVQFERTEDLREIKVGEWQGLTNDEVEARWPGELARRHDDFERHRVPGGETGGELRDRAHRYYTEILERHRGEAVIIISHGGTLAALRSGIHGWDLSRAWRENRTRHPNTAVTVLRYKHATQEHEVEVAASLEHLDSLKTQQGDTE